MYPCIRGQARVLGQTSRVHRPSDCRAQQPAETHCRMSTAPPSAIVVPVAVRLLPIEVKLHMHHMISSRVLYGVATALCNVPRHKGVMQLQTGTLEAIAVAHGVSICAVTRPKQLLLAMHSMPVAVMGIGAWTFLVVDTSFRPVTPPLAPLAPPPLYDAVAGDLPPLDWDYGTPFPLGTDGTF